MIDQFNHMPSFSLSKKSDCYVCVCVFINYSHVIALAIDDRELSLCSFPLVNDFIKVE